MSSPTHSVRRALATAIGAGAIAGATLVVAGPSAFADPPPPVPGCSVGDFEQITAGVAAATSVYMFTHPDVNAFFSSLKGEPREQSRDQAVTYLDANPQTKAELAGIRQPLHDMKMRCQ
ncbi:membrane protein [Mycobacterium antarcticum]|uniref:heme-binding protein n=1 Tax=unclassified Mycolicibacterium TaxID=2636767 RepID=UPI00239D0BE5|nr:MULTISPECIES: heme-binding protein [unclassified Mycolicibacterium]BDX29693.1 membrane protein [Mycolicibacterium sp. TUM20985]GLP73120.1 membrane protein [Mycolicibacterium sp. TUM20983]GLP78833.1 membrane protein [Mycolicibacterium sp. TUM20984]